MKKRTLKEENTEFMLIGSRSRLASVDNNHVLTLGDRHIRRVYYKKSLAMILDQQLNWDKHNHAQCKKISKNIALFKRARLFVPNLISVVFIIPRLEFDANLNSSYTIYPDWNLILISVVLILASQIGI